LAFAITNDLRQTPGPVFRTRLLVRDALLVNEVPAEIRRQRKVLARIEAEYGLQLGHVQSHYLPAHWEQRRNYLGDFGGLHVYLVDVYDVFVSKLSSKQEKHRQDLRVMAPKLDREKARRRLMRDGKAFLDDPGQRPQIEDNWRFIFQEPLIPKTTAAEAPKGRSVSPTRQRGPRWRVGLPCCRIPQGDLGPVSFR
jgi:hypothetical protein